MTSTPADKGKRLLGAATNDELMARSLLPVEGVTDAGIGGHCQQAVEKAIKAVLTARGIDYPYTHNLRYLKELCKQAGIEFPTTLEGAEELTPFALAERYGAEEPISLDREQGLKWADAAVAWAHTVIDEAVSNTPGRADDSKPDQPEQPSA